VGQATGGEERGAEVSTQLRAYGKRRPGVAPDVVTQDGGHFPPDGAEPGKFHDKPPTFLDDWVRASPPIGATGT
jgi:hypothetical protein